MSPISHADAYLALLLQAAGGGRGPLLFGDSLERARTLVPPFLLGQEFPSVYLEHPLLGDPSLDVTVLYGQLLPGTRVASPAAGEHAAMMDWYSEVRKEHPNVSAGFELDTSREELPLAAVHFQPFGETQLVRPFCEAVGMPERADLYLGQAARMPKGWDLAFFGMFRGRPDTPLRVCGYLDDDARLACAGEPSRLAEAFDAIGFEAYGSDMLTQVANFLDVAPHVVDFQFDVFPDRTLGPTFAIDLQFGVERPELVMRSFSEGDAARVMELLEQYGVADDRWRQAVRSAFARWIPVELDDGSSARFSLTLMPQWVKARWTNAQLQPSKLYHYANAKVLDA